MSFGAEMKDFVAAFDSTYRWTKRSDKEKEQAAFDSYTQRDVANTMATKPAPPTQIDSTFITTPAPATTQPAAVPVPPVDPRTQISGYAGGGMVSGASHGEGRVLTPHDYVDLYGAAEATDAGLKYISKAFGLHGGDSAAQQPVRTSAITPVQASGVPNGVHQLANNVGAASPGEVEAAKNAVDPHGQLSEHQRMIATMWAGYKFYIQRGDPTRAEKFAASLIMYSRRQSQMMGAMAQAALQSGDLKTAAAWISKAYNLVPNGHSIVPTGADTTGVKYNTTDINNKVTGTGTANAQQLLGLSNALLNGSAWHDQTMGVAKAHRSRGGGGSGHAGGHGRGHGGYRHHSGGGGGRGRGRWGRGHAGGGGGGGDVGSAGGAGKPGPIEDFYAAQKNFIDNRDDPAAGDRLAKANIAMQEYVRSHTPAKKSSTYAIKGVMDQSPYKGQLDDAGGGGGSGGAGGGKGGAGTPDERMRNKIDAQYQGDVGALNKKAATEEKQRAGAGPYASAIPPTNRKGVPNEVLKQQMEADAEFNKRFNDTSNEVKLADRYKLTGETDPYAGIDAATKEFYKNATGSDKVPPGLSKQVRAIADTILRGNPTMDPQTAVDNALEASKPGNKPTFLGNGLVQIGQGTPMYFGGPAASLAAQARRLSSPAPVAGTAAPIAGAARRVPAVVSPSAAGATPQGGGTPVVPAAGAPAAPIMRTAPPIAPATGAELPMVPAFIREARQNYRPVVAPPAPPGMMSPESAARQNAVDEANRVLRPASPYGRPVTPGEFQPNRGPNEGGYALPDVNVLQHQAYRPEDSMQRSPDVPAYRPEDSLAPSAYPPAYLPEQSMRPPAPMQPRLTAVPYRPEDSVYASPYDAPVMRAVGPSAPANQSVPPEIRDAMSHATGRYGAGTSDLGMTRPAPLATYPRPLPPAYARDRLEPDPRTGSGVNYGQPLAPAAPRRRAIPTVTDLAISHDAGFNDQPAYDQLDGRYAPDMQASPQYDQWNPIAAPRSTAGLREGIDYVPPEASTIYQDQNPIRRAIRSGLDYMDQTGWNDPARDPQVAQPIPRFDGAPSPDYGGNGGYDNPRASPRTSALPVNQEQVYGDNYTPPSIEEYAKRQSQGTEPSVDRDRLARDSSYGDTTPKRSQAVPLEDWDKLMSFEP